MQTITAREFKMTVFDPVGAGGLPRSRQIP
jgi:hypothetical protein